MRALIVPVLSVLFLAVSCHATLPRVGQTSSGDVVLSASRNVVIDGAFDFNSAVLALDPYKLANDSTFIATVKAMVIDLYPCASDPCLHASTCLPAFNKTFTCTCAAGYSGAVCQTDINECLSSPCSNGAVCNDFVNGFNCSCKPGFTGSLCQTDVNECASSPCNNGGSCSTATVSSFTCVCAAGFTGLTCQSDINECASSPCSNGGSCSTTSAANLFSCSCANGFTGVTCQSDIDECASNPCGGNSTGCTNGKGSFTCTCQAGFTGSQCQTDINECQSSPCRNGATCSTPAVNSFTCACTVGFTGSTCQSDINECLSSPCSNGGSCLQGSGPNLFACSCPIGFTGAACQSDLNECASSPCHTANAASCANNAGGFTCACNPGYTGALCQSDINECASSPCSNGGSCTSSAANSFSCSCANGFTGVTCQSDIDECASSPCGGNSAGCTNGRGSFTCTCKPGYTGVLCQSDINECASSPCSNGGVCTTSTINSFNCACAPGFTGATCQSDINECASAPCTNGGSCMQGTAANTFSCSCPNGASGTRCETTNVCFSNPCANGGTCVYTNPGFTCTCPAFTTGTVCETSTATCSSTNCLNNGSCINNVCTCPPFSYGPNCVYRDAWNFGLVGTVSVVQSNAVDPVKNIMYMAGTTTGSFPGFTNLDGNGGTADIVWAALNLTSGTFLYTYQYTVAGSNKNDLVGEIVIDSASNTGLIGGQTYGTLCGAISDTITNIYKGILISFNLATGQPNYCTTIGVNDANSPAKLYQEFVNGIVADFTAGLVWIVGHTSIPAGQTNYLGGFNPSTNYEILVTARTISTGALASSFNSGVLFITGSSQDDYGQDIVYDSSYLYLVGGAGGVMSGCTSGCTYQGGSSDAFIMAISRGGVSSTIKFLKQFGTNGADMIYDIDISIAASKLFVGGSTTGSLPGGGHTITDPFFSDPAIYSDYFVGSFSSVDGSQLFLYQNGTPNIDGVFATAVDLVHNVGIAVGTTSGYLGAAPNPPSAYSAFSLVTDIFIVGFDLITGAPLFNPRQYGSVQSDLANCVVIDNTRGVGYQVGAISGDVTSLGLTYIATGPSNSDGVLVAFNTTTSLRPYV